MHQVVTAQLAARRAGSQSTLTRAEVRGGGAKPWRQKGTGRSRQGSIRSPQWRGGGVTHAPKPRSYAQRTPKKMIRAWRSPRPCPTVSADGKVVVLDGWGIDAPSTKAAVEVLGKLGVDGRVLVVLTRDEPDVPVWKSLRNLGHVHVLTSGELNAYDVLVSDWIVFTRDVAAAPRRHRRGERRSEGPPRRHRRSGREREVLRPDGGGGLHVHRAPRRLQARDPRRRAEPSSASGSPR